MATDEQVRTYADASIKQDVYPLIEILTATEGYLLNNLGKTTATNTIHQTQTDTLRTVASAAVAEGGDYTNIARTTPTLLTNLVQIVAIPFSVTRTQQQVQHFSGENELTRQTKKALMEWADASEFDLVRSTLTSGQSGTAPTMSLERSNLTLPPMLDMISSWKLIVNNAIKDLKQSLLELKMEMESFVLGSAIINGKA